jgi:hypothetical protein
MQEEITPFQVSKGMVMLCREQIQVTRIAATPKSVIQ